MRFKNTLNETLNTTLEDILYKIYYDCMPFLKELLRGSYNDQLLYSGRNGNKDFIIKKIRKDRYPKDTPGEIHEILDNEFYEKFGVNARSNSIFCTGNFNEADGYGDTVYAIFPKGRKYTYIWSKSYKDLYSDWYDSGNHFIYTDSDIESGVFDIDIEQMATELARETYTDYVMTLDPDEDELPDEDEWVQDHLDDYTYDATYIMKEKMQNDLQDELDSLMQTYQDYDLQAAIKSGNEIMLITDTVYGIHEYYLKALKYYFKKNGLNAPTRKRMQDTFGGYGKSKLYQAITLYKEDK